MFKRCGYLLAAIMLVSFSFSSVLAQTPSNRVKPLDFYGNNLSDWVTLSADANDNYIWHILKNENPSPSGPGQATIARPPWGGFQTPEENGDYFPAFGNYSGNTTNDLVVFRANADPTRNFYWVQPFPGGTPFTMEWGIFSDFIPGAEGDYDGDGRMDPTAIRNNAGKAQWWIWNSSNNTVSIFDFGNYEEDNYFLPGADYTGDGKDDPATVRVAGNGQVTWYVADTRGVQIRQVDWGNYDTDYIIPAGDYDGDGRADFMVWRAGGNGVWYLLTNSGNIRHFYWGVPGFQSGDYPLRSGDYDGDGITDVATWRPSTQQFWVRASSRANPDSNPMIQRWGSANHIPLASFGIE